MEAPFPIRKIIHVDMDAFYASVAQLDDPSLVGKPIAVGGSSKRGVVSAASYEARKYGVRSAMSGMLARKLCPDLIFVKTDFERYKEISNRIRSIFLSFTDMVEPLSLDEAYLDVTQNKVGNPSATLIAQEIRARIKEKTGLNASAGISINKFIAKVASDINKPNGQKTVPPEEVLAFLEQLDIKKFYGVGKVMKEKMYRHGIYTGRDLKLKSLAYLETNFGKSGAYYYDIVRGIQHSKVKPSRTRKSLAAERTFSENISSELFMIDRLEEIAQEVERRLQKSKVAGKTITLKIKYSDFTLQTRSKTLPLFVSSKSLIMNTVKDLLFQEKMKDSVRLLGISLSNLNTEDSKDTNASEEKSIDVQLKLDF
ncbi:MAG: DNA polymerase IV [Flavobacteriales bacterium]|jgi:DNA polymerase-4|uniref:DNA polymerase IV n=1 Tax=Candidatus Ulvibacter alkanivorans TaxID=2267620 RepID=UPI000DF3337E|nr:DNA polymerase IV [Candidatus Ulvibacter alkanivorans]MCH2489801.1 DNA polymerase IV [Flavobacteriales bacterium]